MVNRSVSSDDMHTDTSPSVMVNRPVMQSSILTMPLKGARAAPAKFKGKYSKIREFIMHYELLLAQHNVTNSTDQCELVTRYCSTKVTEFIKALPSYNEDDWAALREDLLKYYDADLDSKKYHAPDLPKFAKASRNGKIKNLSEWRAYGRNFITIGGWLLKKKKISSSEFATQYWNGIPRSFRNKIENRLLASDPTRSLLEPFKVSDINKAAEGLLQRDRFDSYINYSDEDSDDEDSDSEENDSSSDSEDEMRKLRSKIKRKAKLHHKKARFSVSESDSESSDDDAPQVKVRPNKGLKKKVNSKREPDVENLIKELNSMSINDPGYSALVYRAMKRDPDILKVVRPAVFSTNVPAPPAQYPPRSNVGFQPQPPPHMNSNYPPRQYNNAPSGPPRPYNNGPPTAPRQFNNAPAMSNECYGCHESGHMMSRCPKISELENKGLLRRIDGKWRAGDGSFIPKMPGESLVDACTRTSFNNSSPSAASHLIRVVGLNMEEQSDLDDDAFYCHTRSDNAITTDSDTDWLIDSDDQTYEPESDTDALAAAVISPNHPQTRRYAFPVERAPKTTVTKRKEVMDGVYMPARRGPIAKNGRDKENTPITPIAPIAPAQSNAPATRSRARSQAPVLEDKTVKVPAAMPSRPEVVKPTKTKEQIPFDTREPEFDGQRDDMIIEDQPSIKRAKDRRTIVPEQTRSHEEITQTKDAFDKRITAPRQSEITAHTRPVQILNQLLNTRIDLAIGEVLGISKELSGMMSDKIKMKSAKVMPPVATFASSLHTKSRGNLINLHMQCDGRQISAIIDTGSQLNIVSKSICDSRILRPVDLKQTMSIADANGGKGKLIGMVADVPLHCGSVKTLANLYVGTHVPFELLLGRPWQKENQVSIEERNDGTYIAFKDRRYAIRVGSEDSDVPNYNLPDWAAEESEVAFLISTDSNGSEYNEPGSATDLMHMPTSATFSELIATTQQTLKQEPNYSPFPDEHPDEITELISPNVHLPGSQELGEYFHIKVDPEITESLPHILPVLSQSMSTSQTLYPTAENSALPLLRPVGHQPYLRLHSELVNAALGDAPFLHRTNNLHSLTLSSASSLQLGPGTDLANYPYIDYIFLHAGLIDTTTNVPTVAHANAFVRIFPNIGTDIPPLWLVPYPAPPSNPADVSGHLILPPVESKLTRVEQLRAEALRPTSDEIMELQKFRTHTGVNGVRAADSRYSPSNTSTNSLTSGVAETATSSAMGDVPTLTIGRSATSLPRKNRIITTNTRRSLRIAAAEQRRRQMHTPSPSISPATQRTSIRSTETPPITYMGNSYYPSSESSSDSEDQLMSDSEMEWRQMRREIRNDIDEEMRNDAEGASDKTNRFIASFRLLTGLDPSDELLSFLAADLEQDTQDIQPQNTPEPLDHSMGPDLMRSDPPLSHHDADLLLSLARTSQPTADIKPNFRPVTPRKPSLNPLAIPFVPRTIYSVQDTHTPRPISVFHIATCGPESDSPSSIPDLISDKADDESPGDDEPATPDPLTWTDTPGSAISPLQLAPPGTTALSPPILIPTRPNSPSVNDKLRRDPFGRSRLITRNGLVHCLEVEAERIRALGPEERIMREEPGYAEYEARLRQTLERLDASSDDDIGVLPPFRIFLLGLIALLNYKDHSHSAVAEASLPKHRVATHVSPAESEHMQDSPVSTESPQSPRTPHPGESIISPPGSPHTNPPDYDEDRAHIPQCPSRPHNIQDPRTTPIGERRYIQGGSNNYVREPAQIEGIAYVDIRTGGITTDLRGTSPEHYRTFTRLGGNLEGFWWPARLLQADEFPNSIATTVASTYQMRFMEMYFTRREIDILIQRVSDLLTDKQKAECRSPYIYLHQLRTPSSKTFVRVRLDRSYVLMRLNPYWNPFLKPHEASYLRSAYYILADNGHPLHAEQIDRVLRTPHWDDWEIRELLCLGAFDTADREDDALRYFARVDNAHWSFHATESEGTIVFVQPDSEFADSDTTQE